MTFSVLLNGTIQLHTMTKLALQQTRSTIICITNAGNVTETAPTTSGRYVRLIGHNIYDKQM
jgi:hypothetical protein